MKRSALKPGTKALSRKTTLGAKPGPKGKSSLRSRTSLAKTHFEARESHAQPAKQKRAKSLKSDPNGLAAQAKVFHDLVFAHYGPRCYWFALCRNVRDSDDAAHIIPKSKLGPYRYQAVEFARPAHRRCHELQTACAAGYVWRSADLNLAVLTHDAIPSIRVFLGKGKDEDTPISSNNQPICDPDADAQAHFTQDDLPDQPSLTRPPEMESSHV